jgi:hypothetical protein
MYPASISITATCRESLYSQQRGITPPEYDLATHWKRTAEGYETDATDSAPVPDHAQVPAGAAQGPTSANETEWSLAIGWNSAKHSETVPSISSDGRRRLIAFIGIFVCLYSS